MKNLSVYEKTGIRNRLREIFTLSVIFIISFIISLVAMDIIIFPVAFFAVNNKEAFTFVFKYAFWIIILIAILYSILRRIFSLRKDGFPVSQILKSVFLRPFSLLFFFIVILLIGFALVIVINFLFQNNNYFLYKIINV